MAPPRENDDVWHDELEEAQEHDECVVDIFFAADPDVQDEQRSASEASHSEPEQPDEGVEGHEAENGVAPETADHGGYLVPVDEDNAAARCTLAEEKDKEEKDSRFKGTKKRLIVAKGVEMGQEKRYISPHP